MDKELLKSNHTHDQSSAWHADSKSKNSDLACVEEKVVLSLLIIKINGIKR